MIIYSIGPTSRPFEPRRKADTLKQESEFMELHGGRGSRLIYLAVLAVESWAGMPGRMLRGIGRRLAATTQTGGPAPRCATPIGGDRARQC